MAILNDIYGSMGISAPSYSSATSGAAANPYQGAQQLNVPGLGTFSNQDVVSYINTHPNTEIASIANQYNIDPAALVASYNAGAGTNFSVADAYNYLGMAQPQSLMPDIPFNLYPSSSSSSGSSSHSGINWDSDIGQTILPLLQGAVTDLPGLAESLPGTLQELYKALMKSGLGPNAFQGTLNSLASRNMLNSSVASDAMAKTAKDIMNKVGLAGYNSMLEGLKAQMGVGSTLASIAQTGQESTSSGGSSSSSSNPLAPYELYSSMLMYGGG